jgi:hypothetical protein
MHPVREHHARRGIVAHNTTVRILDGKREIFVRVSIGYSDRVRVVMAFVINAPCDDRMRDDLMDGWFGGKPQRYCKPIETLSRGYGGGDFSHRRSLLKYSSCPVFAGSGKGKAGGRVSEKGKHFCAPPLFHPVTHSKVAANPALFAALTGLM